MKPFLFVATGVLVVRPELGYTVVIAALAAGVVERMFHGADNQ